jgi:hypothetical protein
MSPERLSEQVRLAFRKSTSLRGPLRFISAGREYCSAVVGAAKITAKLLLQRDFP